MMTLAACTTGCILDLLFGDPVWLYHPVRLIGAWIARLETWARRLCGERKHCLLAAGMFLWILVIVISAGVPWLMLLLAGRVHPFLRFVLESIWCYQLLAAKSLKTESMKVYQALEKQNLQEARKAVSMIVGRDTKCLDEIGVAKAAVETVAENTTDGVIAPLLFLFLGGVPLGFFYKAVNTMDSMLGYKEERYLYLGRCAAKMDDLVNYIPARITALLMIASAQIQHMDGKNAWRIYQRDKRKHASPNAAQTEAVCAGALQIQLAGDAYYFGERYHKEYIGDAIRPVEAEDIVRGNHLMYGTAFLAFFLFGMIRVCWILL